MRETDLIDLYNKSSKHSNYQILSDRLLKIIGEEKIQVKSRFEKERLHYIDHVLDIKGKTILDVGGNTGYFSFEMLEKGAAHVDYIEGNSEHAQFVAKAAQVLGYANKISIQNRYLNFKQDLNERYDIILLLNVLHHVGDDYGDKKTSIEKAKQEIIDQLCSLKDKAQTIVFQLGFNWKGDTNQCLFEDGTKQEMIAFFENGIKDVFEMTNIGIAEKGNDSLNYKELNNHNIKRNDSLGEFLNRPVFVLRSK